MTMRQECNGFDIKAYARPIGGDVLLFRPTVTLVRHITRHSEPKTIELNIDMKVDPVSSADEAERVAMAHGIALVNGEVPGFDPDRLTRL